MYDLIRRHEVFVLHDAGLSNRRIAEQLKMSEGTVRTILAEPRVETVVRAELGKPKTGVGRPSIMGGFEKEIRTILQNEPALPTVEILHRLRQKGYAGSKSPVYEFVASIRPKNETPVVRFEGLPGEFSQHDFGQSRVKYENGQVEVVHFFASKLKYSRWADVEIVENEGVESLVRALLRGFQSFQGVPLVAVFDNPKTIVISRDADKIEWNETFGQVALDFRFAPELCYPHMANQKGSVENLVGWVKGSFFKVRRFHDREDMLHQLVDWHNEANLQRPSRATGVPPAARIEEERKRFRPLAFSPEEYALRFPIFVGPTGWVEFRGIRYSMHPKAISMAGTLFLYTEKVEIVAGKYRAVHPRKPGNGKISTLQEHSAAGVAAVCGSRGKLYFKRQRLMELGSDAESFLTEILHCRQYTWKHDVEKLFDLLEMVGAEALMNAIRRAHERNLFGAEYVEELLQEKVK